MFISKKRICNDEGYLWKIVEQLLYLYYKEDGWSMTNIQEAYLDLHLENHFKEIMEYDS